MRADDELDAHVRSLEAERLRATPPPPSVNPRIADLERRLAEISQGTGD